MGPVHLTSIPTSGPSTRLPSKDWEQLTLIKRSRREPSHACECHVTVMWTLTPQQKSFCIHVYTQYKLPLCVMWLSHDLWRGQVIASMGDALEAELSECLPIFVDRLRNEITRLTAVRAVTLVARYVTTAPGENFWASVIKFIFSDRHLKLTSTSFWWVKILSLLGFKIVWKF